MKPFKFEGYQKELGKPASWDQNYTQKCDRLPICYGDKMCISHWRPTLIERVKIAFGAGVWMFVANGGSGTQPPVALQAGFARRAE